MEDELDLSTPVERDITSESGAADGMAGGGVDIAAQAEAELSRMSGADEQQSADKESTTAWDNPDVVSRLNLNSNNDALTSNAQQVWQESYGIKGGDENSQPISEKAKAEKQAADDDKRADFMERQEREAEDRAERRRAEEDRALAKLEHMSLGDLQKMHAMLANPAMQEKIESRLSKNGMSKDRIEKGKSEMKEYLELRMKQEKEGKDKLTETEQQRLKDIKQSEEFKAFSVEANNAYNVDLKANIAENKAKERSMDNLRQVAGDNVDGMLADRISKLQGSSRDEMSKDESSRSAAYAHFSSARNVGDEFKEAASNDQPNKLSLKQENDAKVTTAPRTVIAQIQADAAMI